MENQPLVTVAIPTYNRPELLKKAIECTINQTYKNLDILISDNCSEDPKVEQICREYAAKDKRIRYFRQKENIGITANGRFIESNAIGEYYTCLTDDDWLSENFVEECMKVMLNNPDCTIASGYVINYDENYNVHKESCFLSIDQDNYIDRFKVYYAQPWLFGTYGIRRVSDIKRAAEFKDRICEDWAYTSKFLFMGKFYILDNCVYHKLWTGMTATLDGIKEYFNLPEKTNQNDLLKLCAKACEDSILKDKLYNNELSDQERQKLAKLVYSIVINHKETPIKYSTELLKYMWQHPLFLFKAKFYETFFPYACTLTKYILKHPLFLFREDFYRIFMPHTYKVTRYMWRHPNFIIRKDFYKILIGENS